MNDLSFRMTSKVVQIFNRYVITSLSNSFRHFFFSQQPVTLQSSFYNCPELFNWI